MSKLSRHSLDRTFGSQLRYLTTTLRPGTFVTYRATVNRFLHFLHAAFPEVQQLSQLRRDPHILAWLGHLCEQDPPLANGSRRNYLWAMRRLLEELASQYPCLQKALILGDDIPPADHYLPRPLSPEDDGRLQGELRRSDDLESNALLLMRATGIRIGECLRLTTDCLRHLGEDQWALHVPLGKLHTERWVPVDDETRHIVDRILSLRQAAPLRAPAELSHYLLPQARNLRASYHRIRQTLNAAAERAGCSARIVPHQLRHSYASEMLRAGASLPVVKELLGHKELRMTLRYINVTQNDLQREFHTARLKLANDNRMFPLPFISDSDKPTADIPTIARSLAATRHLLEMYRRQLDDRTIRRQLERLANRLIKVAGELDQLAGPSE